MVCVCVLFPSSSKQDLRFPLINRDEFNYVTYVVGFEGKDAVLV